MQVKNSRPRMKQQNQGLLFQLITTYGGVASSANNLCLVKQLTHMMFYSLSTVRRQGKAADMMRVGLTKCFYQTSNDDQEHHFTFRLICPLSCCQTYHCLTCAEFCVRWPETIASNLSLPSSKFTIVKNKRQYRLSNCYMSCSFRNLITICHHNAQYQAL